MLLASMKDNPESLKEQCEWAKLLAPLVKLPGFPFFEPPTNPGAPTTTAPDRPGVSLHWDNVFFEPPTAPGMLAATTMPDQPEHPRGRRPPCQGSGPIAAPQWNGPLQWDDAVMRSRTS